MSRSMIELCVGSEVREEIYSFICMGTPSCCSAACEKTVLSSLRYLCSFVKKNQLNMDGWVHFWAPFRSIDPQVYRTISITGSLEVKYVRPLELFSFCKDALSILGLLPFPHESRLGW